MYILTLALVVFVVGRDSKFGKNLQPAFLCIAKYQQYFDNSIMTISMCKQYWNFNSGFVLARQIDTLPLEPYLQSFLL
jgi:hypothetical protein